MIQRDQTMPNWPSSSRNSSCHFCCHCSFLSLLPLLFFVLSVCLHMSIAAFDFEKYSKILKKKRKKNQIKVHCLWWREPKKTQQPISTFASLFWNRSQRSLQCHGENFRDRLPDLYILTVSKWPTQTAEAILQLPQLLQYLHTLKSSLDLFSPCSCTTGKKWRNPLLEWTNSSTEIEKVAHHSHMQACDEVGNQSVSFRNSSRGENSWKLD